MLTAPAPRDAKTELTELTAEQSHEGLLFAFAHGWRPGPGPAADSFDDDEAPTARIATGFLAAHEVQS